MTFGNALRCGALPLFDRLLKAGAALHASRLAERDPVAAQRRIFRHLVARGASTRFGADHGLAELAQLPFPEAYRRFRSCVPIRTYEEFWNEYFKQGAKESGGRLSLSLTDVTWPGRVPFFCETSGTTAPSKYIPFTMEMFSANRRAALDLATCYLSANRRSRLVGGKLLYMAGSTELRDMGNGVKSGDMSAITLRYRPRYLDPFIAPDAATALLPWEEKLERLAELLLRDRSIRGISGVPPWILLLLNRCVEMGGAPISRLLPDLELIIHGGTSLKPYRQEFDHLFEKGRPQFLEVLPSSEAFMGFQRPGEAQMRLEPYYGAFFEFTPCDELDDRGRPSQDARCVPLEEVEIGRRYAVILTTCAGLWRYHIGDTIRFTGRDPLFIEFTGRDKFLDRFEEKVTQGEVEEAVSLLNGMQGVEIREFMVGPQISERRHLWVLAVGNGATGNSRELARHLDDALAGMNADYRTFRVQGRIKPPRVLAVSEDDIYLWSRDVRGKLGGQSKIPHVDPTLEGELVASLAGYCMERDRG